MNSVNVLGKDIYYYDSTDPVIYYLKHKNLYGAQNYSLLNKFILNDSPNAWIIDCGAHIGTFSFIPAVENKNILMIEAAKKNIECLNKTYHGMKNAIVEDAILLESQYQCSFSSDYGPFGSATISNEGSQISESLDNICKKHNISEVSAIKFDIEGNEISAIKGSYQVINQNSPPILVEINGYALLMKNHKPQELLKTIENMGYRGFLYQNNELIPIDSKKKFPFCVTDAICLHESNIESYAKSIKITASLSESDIDQIINHQKSSTNSECQQYFRSL